MAQTSKNKKRKPTTSSPTRVLHSHDELLQDMRQFQQEVTSTAEAAMAFLKRAGLLSSSGQQRQLIRG